MEPKRRHSLLDKRWLPGLLLLVAPLLMGKFGGGPTCDCSKVTEALPKHHNAWTLYASSEPFEFPLADGTALLRFQAVVQVSAPLADVDAEKVTFEAVVTRPKLLGACDMCSLCHICEGNGIECACEIREFCEADLTRAGQPLEPDQITCGLQYSNVHASDPCAPSSTDCSCGSFGWTYTFLPSAFEQTCDADGCQLTLELDLSLLNPSGDGYNAFWNADGEVQAYTPEDAGPATLVFNAAVLGPWVEMCDGCYEPPAPEDYEVTLEAVLLP